MRALDDVDLELRRGEVHALLGENGAGKSTLIKVLTGVYQKDGGKIFLDGVEISPRDPRDAQLHGISTVYQEVNLLPNLSVAHNIFIGREPTRFARVDWTSMKRQSRELLARFNLDIDVEQALSSYSVAVQQLVAIARGVDCSAKVLILDEPTASLDAQEVEHLFEILRLLKQDGVAIVFVTHFLDQVYDLSDRISVLRNGKKVGTFDTATLARPQLIEHMLGRSLQALEAEKKSAASSADSADDFFVVEDLCVDKSIGDISFSVQKGSATALAGLLGSGRTEVCKAIFGVDKLSKGKLKIDGVDTRSASPREAVRQGMGFCPEDRKTEGIVGPLSVRENIALALQAKRGWWKRLSRQEQNELAEHSIKLLKIACSDADKAVELLSGGNQQKVILARWLAVRPKLLILDEPTRGIDIGAHEEIIRLIRQLCEEGMALLVTSSELEELVVYSDKVIVLRDLRKVSELCGEQISEDNIMLCIAHNHSDAAESRA